VESHARPVQLSVQVTLDLYSHLMPELGLKERAAARLALWRLQKTGVRTAVKLGKKW
jgi:hypothetical protein